MPNARELLEEAGRNVAQRLGGAAKDELQRRRAQPCVTAEYFRLRLQSCRPFMRPWFRWRFAVWRDRCKAAGFDRRVCGG